MTAGGDERQAKGIAGRMTAVSSADLPGARSLGQGKEA
jgi:hypothetical protein